VVGNLYISSLHYIKSMGTYYVGKTNEVKRARKASYCSYLAVSYVSKAVQRHNHICTQQSSFSNTGSGDSHSVSATDRQSSFSNTKAHNNYFFLTR
jgi:hypothetical protein